MTLEFINPSALGSPRGYSNGVLVAPGSAMLFVAGQIAWDETQTIVSADFATQFGQALENVITVVSSAGGAPTDITRLLIFVTTRDEYVEQHKKVGEEYRKRMGKHFPAMALVEVKALLEPTAKVEIEAIAAIAPKG